jgi:enoyl-[acyl-carrier protein] reductase I
VSVTDKGITGKAHSADFLDIRGKTILVFGVANRKSVAYSVGEVLSEAGANVIYSVQSAEARQSVARILPGADIYVCDVEQKPEIERLAGEIPRKYPALHGVVHSIAFANYEGGLKPFHETRKENFLQAVDISCYSLIAIANAFRDLLDKKGAVVTISISTTKMAAEPYGFMAPVKAALDSTVCFLAKSFSSFSQVRFNSVNAGLLKTSASAGIPGYLDYYLFAEELTLRKKALDTREVANTVAFLLSPRSSGINAQGIVVDAGMSVNYFDKGIIKKALRTQ